MDVLFRNVLVVQLCLRVCNIESITCKTQYGLAALPASPKINTEYPPHHDLVLRPTLTFTPTTSRSLSLCFWDIRDTVVPVNLGYQPRDLEFRAPDVLFVA